MAYVSTIINRHVQLGSLNVEVVLTDDAGLRPDYRQWLTLPAAATEGEIAAAAAVVAANVEANLPEQEADGVIDAA